MSDPEYRTADFLRFPLSNQSELVYSRDSFSTRILPSHLIDYLLRCRIFRTIESHAQAICQELNLSQEKLSLVREDLDRLLDVGLLVSKEALIEKCGRLSKGQNVRSKISSVGFPTRNRVKSLHRALVSYIENAQKYERNHDFIISDASPNLETRDQYREMLRSLKAGYNVKIFYVGLEEKESFSRILAQKGLPEEVINFALFDIEKTGTTFGLCRNALLLHSVGEAIFMSDDDTLCQVTSAPGSGNTLQLVSGLEPTEFCFFSNTEMILKTVPFVDQDILGLHEELLGEDLWKSIDRALQKNNLNFERMSPSFYRRLSTLGGRVLLTMTGVAGDSGMGSPTNYLFLSGVSRERLLKSESEYRSAIVSRQILRKVNFPTITDGAFCMTISIGLDNREILPPFIPVQRNEDAVFGLTFRKCFEEGYMGYLPWALLHVPLEELRSFSPETIWGNSGGVGFTDIISHCIRAFELTTDSSPIVRMKALGKFLMEFGLMELQDFEEFVLLRVLKQKSDYIAYVENLLKVHQESPKYWAEDVKRHLGLVREGLAQKDYLVPPDLRRIFPGDEARKLTQRLVFKFGQLLFWWPEIIESAKSLKAEGQRLAQLV